jgi:peptidoglycan/xylan/chitin deacetylase (PgdA/CDA1 family)
MSPVEERAYLDTVAQRIEKEEGARPGGWSSPWLTQTTHTIDLLAECGYRYLLDLRADDQPVWLTSAHSPVLAIPYALELNDSTSIIGRQVTAADFADMIIDEFDELLAASRHQPLVMSIVLHSFISGAPFRLRQVARALKHIATHRDLVWLTQPRHLYDAFAETCPPQVGDQTIGGGDG